MDNRPDIFDSKARLRDLSSLDIESLPPEMAELYTTLREVYVHNFEAEQYAAKVAHQIRIVAKLVQAERAERQRQQPIDSTIATKQWIASQRAVARGEL